MVINNNYVDKVVWVSANITHPPATLAMKPPRELLFLGIVTPKTENWATNYKTTTADVAINTVQPPCVWKRGLGGKGALMKYKFSASYKINQNKLLVTYWINFSCLFCPASHLP